MVDDGRTTEHGYTISSPCEPDGSGELKTCFIKHARLYVTCTCLSYCLIQYKSMKKRNDTPVNSSNLIAYNNTGINIKVCKNQMGDEKLMQVS